MTRLRAIPLSPTYITFCPSGVKVSRALPFTTNMTISTSISQTFLSWVAISNLHQPMVCWSHSSNSMPGLPPLMHVLVWERCVFHVNVPGQGYVLERLKSSLKKFYGQYGIQLNLMKSLSSSLSEMLHSGRWSYTVTPSINQTFHYFVALLPKWTLLPLPLLALSPNSGRFSSNGCG